MKLKKLKIFIASLLANKINIFIAIVFGLLAGYALLKIISLAGANMFFIIGLPFVFIFAFITIVNTQAMLIILLFSRALLDPLLNLTKVDMLNQRIGIGGLINLFVVIFAFFIFLRDPRRLIKNKFFQKWCIFLFICFIAIFYSPVSRSALKIFFNLVTYMCIALIPFFIIKNINEKKFWIKIIIFSSLLPIVIANVSLLRNPKIFIPGFEARLQGTFSHPNILAFYLVLIVTLTFYILKSKQFSLSKARVNILRIYIINLFILLLATKTRSAWISCWTLFFLYGLLREKKYLFYTIIVPPVFLLNYAIWERVKEILSPQTHSIPELGLSSLAWRLRLWKSSLSMVQQKLIFGHGLASFLPLSKIFFLLERQRGAPAHNTYLELLFETGVLGVVSYILIYISALKEFYRGIKDKIAGFSAEYAIVFSCTISYLIISFADNMLYYLAFNWYFWFFIGIMLRGLQLGAIDGKEVIDNNSVL